MELTKLYLGRLARFDPLLKCVVNFTGDLALKQAARADKEIASGAYRGPLHGIPWGAKDLIAYPGYPTTWGATPFKDRVIDVKATVAARLEEAGAVLVAKLSLGALAMGDQWFGGRTHSPWDPRTGSERLVSRLGLGGRRGAEVGFAIGSETLGGIVSPARPAAHRDCARPSAGSAATVACRCRGRWTSSGPSPDRSKTAATVLPMRSMASTRTRLGRRLTSPSIGPPRIALETIKVGYIAKVATSRPKRAKKLNVLRMLGFDLVPITLPDELPVQAVTLMLAGTEAAAAFDEITRSISPKA